MVFDSAFFDAGLDRRGVQSFKWEMPGMMAEGQIPLWVADMDFATAPAIVEALTRRAEHPNYGYTFVGEALPRAFCAYWQRRYGAEISPDQVGLLPSVVSGLRAGVQQFSCEGEGVIIQSPVYGPFAHAITALNRRVMDAPLVRDAAGRYHMDLALLESHLKAGARLMLLCSPHNPVSRAWDRQELEALVALLRRYQCALVADEIHADFVYALRRFVSMLAIDTEGLPMIALSAASKTFNIAGLQLASLVCRDGKLLKEIGDSLHANGVEAGNLFALTANLAAYTQADDWLDGLIAYLDGSRTLLRQELERLLPEALLSPIEATFLAWLDLRAYRKSNARLMEACRAAGVVPTDGRSFGEQAGEGFLRINFGCPRRQLMAGLDRLARAVKG